ncbi:hypothetical protein CPC735_025800 [Coccidioides posadasii C735 delta SOWgp]|uniref:Ribonucleases P/MRP subunit Pop8-like domain-containing protein n=1 Tax=Coccidioides posadasii (strain C735) TaxID=222929 RepID=C5P744_COCP7|nr:hypothetical protein CPC735_025800 [Coccidioides posadasii C735 delta SOWgp]EER27244.1 hypothetical protein CPC735_025800 [Coccidioides posadasii C735 delta SOWgp]|eukprot:XP_003069389.1 hypothetical protein CPC735_025800 [Coccidioides posadasii C735 delta SOWgp]
MAKRKRNSTAEGAGKKKTPDTTITFISRKPEWAYIHLELVTQPPSSNSEPLDLLTAKTYLTSALSQFLGLSGTAIPFDILKLQAESLPTRNTLWIRVPHGDAAALIAAVSSWVGGSSGDGGSSVAWKIRAKGSWLGALVGGTGRELFAQ